MTAILRITPMQGTVLRIDPTEGPSMKLEAVMVGGLHPRGLSGFCAGRPVPKPEGEVVAAGIAPYNFVVTEDGLVGKARVEADADTVFNVWKEDLLGGPDILLGYLTFAAGSRIAVPTVVTGSVVKGQSVEIRGPVFPDVQLEDIMFLVTEG